MENVGFTNISNNFHDFPNSGSGSRGFSKIMEIVGFTNIFREPIMENVGFTNNFHDFPNHRSSSRGFSKFMEIVGFVGFNNIFRAPIMEIVGFLRTISMILQTLAPAHEVFEIHGNCWNC